MEEARPNGCQPTQIAVAIMAKALAITSPHHLLEDEYLGREMDYYTNPPGNPPSLYTVDGTRGIALQQLPPFMTE